MKKYFFWMWSPKQVLQLLYTLLLSCLLIGCQKKTTAARLGKQELHLNIRNDPPCLDPRKASDFPSLLIIRMCFEGLMGISPSGEVVPALAERVEISADQKTYTFFLRESIWSDGHPLTAYDFEKSWKTMLDPAFPCHFANDLYVIKNAEAAKAKKCSLDAVGVKALDPHTLVVELTYPTPYFLELTVYSLYPAPTHITEEDPHWAQESGPHYVCNGPFCLTDWHHHNDLVVRKNAHYWDKDSVRLQALFFAMIEDENTELTLFENGELDWTGSPLSSLPIDALPSLMQQGVVTIYPMSGVYFYLFNTKAPPFDNVHMRRAFTLAMNRQEIVKNVTQSGQIPALNYIPPTIWKETRPLFKDADLEEAQRLFNLALQEMGMTKELLPEIRLSYNTMSCHHKIAQAIQEQWLKALGVSVVLENKEWKVFLDQLNGRQFQVARMGGIAYVNDPSAFLHLYKYLSGSNNHTQWTNPEFTELLEKSEMTPDPQERLSLLRRAEEIFIDEMPIAPIYFYTGCYIKKPYVKGAILSEKGNINFKYAYVESP